MPYVAQLKPGVLQILHEEGTSESEKYFVSGGLALTHPDSSTVRRKQQHATLRGDQGQTEQLSMRLGLWTLFLIRSLLLCFAGRGLSRSCQIG